MSQHVLRIGGREYQAEIKELTPERARVVVDGTEYAVDILQLGRRTLTADAVRAVPPPSSPSASGVRPAAPAPAPVASRPSPAGRGEGGIVAPMPGLVLAIKAKEGDTVAAGPFWMHQVRSAVGCDHGLAGAGVSLDHQRLVCRAGDQVVLVGLQRG